MYYKEVTQEKKKVTNRSGLWYGKVAQTKPRGRRYLFAMDKITQTARYRQSLILYAQKHGVTKAAIRYHTNRQYIYRWSKRHDGTLKSL